MVSGAAISATGVEIRRCVILAQDRSLAHGQVIASRRDHFTR